MVSEKECTKCKTVKPASEFRPEPRYKSGLKSWCKQCECEYSVNYMKTPAGKAVKKKHEEKHKEEYRVKRQAYEKTPGARARASKYNGSEKGKQYKKVARLRSPEKRQARDAVNNAVKSGKVESAKRFTCFYEGCSKQAQEYHHYLGYNPEHYLDVKPVCITHHRLLDSQSNFT